VIALDHSCVISVYNTTMIQCNHSIVATVCGLSGNLK